MGNGEKTVKELDIKVKDENGYESDVHIMVDETTDRGEIKTSGGSASLTDLKKGADGKRIVGDTKKYWKKFIVTMSVEDGGEVPEVRVVARGKNGKVWQNDTYTLTHEDKDRLVAWFKGLKVDILPSEAGGVA
ncbi:MAG: hypothetical protein V3V45_01155 [Candidatus Brocadiales bacterium]